MPTALRIGAYRLFFYSADGDEPPHIHVERDGRIAKFWLDPVRLARSGGFTSPEIARMNGIEREHADALMEAWHDFFGS